MTDISRTDDIAYFISFCVEIYKKNFALSGAEVADVFVKNGIMDYLAANYDVLHTQSPQWILDEINEIIKNKV